ncbi:Spy/CpxP family protein refolding chaperone [Dyella sp. 2HG41-7]|uniref:Spy/CpxP family protein refolding chaperone n=1 Tax=Dyella sp. 2HG41-7 TaxID=2883239 RepID=UPI001F339D8F|nr:Spy/CpxP family protein refolding chaperone [Dyella sp. 2HG41-7]
MKNAIRTAAVPFVLSLALLAGAAVAQSTAPASSGSSSAAPAASKTRAERKADMVEQQITDLHTKLEITDAQSSEWNAYADVMRNNARRASEAFQQRAQKMSSMNADDVMKSYAQLAQMHAEDMQKLSDAWSALYAKLSPEQKENADALFEQKAMKPHGKHSMPKSSKPAPGSSSAGASGT